MKVYKIRNKITGKFYTGNHHVSGWSDTGRTWESLQDLKNI